MTREELCFIEAILAEPNEVAHRFVFADWLMDRDRDEDALLVHDRLLGRLWMTYLRNKPPEGEGQNVWGRAVGRIAFVHLEGVAKRYGADVRTAHNAFTMVARHAVGLPDDVDSLAT